MDITIVVYDKKSFDIGNELYDDVNRVNEILFKFDQTLLGV